MSVEKKSFYLHFDHAGQSIKLLQYVNSIITAVPEVNINNSIL